MISARVPAALITRIDYVVRNTEGTDTKNRSAALQTALEYWLTVQENVLYARGLRPEKTR